MSDFWRFRLLRRKGRTITLRVTALSTDCGDQFPHTIDWLARSLYCAGGEVEEALDQVAGALERRAGPDAEGTFGFDIAEANDRLADAVIAAMSVRLVDDPEDPDAGDGPQAEYVAELRPAAVARAIAALGEPWSAPCFDLASLCWRLEKGGRHRVVHWDPEDGGRFGERKGNASAAWRDAVPEASELPEQGDHAAAKARVERAVRSGWQLLFCNHAGAPAALPIVRRPRKPARRAAPRVAPATKPAVAAAAPEPRERPAWVVLGALQRATRAQIEALAALAGTTVADSPCPKDVLILGDVPAAEAQRRLGESGSSARTEAQVVARHLLGASLDERRAAISRVAAAVAVDGDGFVTYPWQTIVALVDGAPSDELDATLAHATEALSSWPDGWRLAGEGWLGAGSEGERRLALARGLAVAPDRPRALAALEAGRVPAHFTCVELRLDEAGTRRALAQLAGRPFASMTVKAKGVADWRALVAALPAGLRRLDLSFCGGGAALAEALAEAPLAATVEDLDLGWNALGAAGAQALAGAAWPSLRALSLRDAGLKRGALEGMLPGLARVESLGLANNALKAAGAQLLARTELPRLSTLDLGGNEIGDEGLAALAGSTSLPALHTLRVAGNQAAPLVGPKGVDALAGGPLARQLRTLDLRGNALQGALPALFRAESLAGLETLALGDVPGGIAALMELGKEVAVRPRSLSIDSDATGNLSKWKDAQCLARLHTLRLGGSLSERSLVGLLSTAPLGALEVLEVKVTGAALQALLAAPWAKRLRRLRLSGLEAGHGALLAAAPFAGTLEELFAWGLGADDRAAVRASYGSRAFV